MEVAEDQTEVMKKSETLEETETLPLVDEEHGSRTIKERKQQSDSFAFVANKLCRTISYKPNNSTNDFTLVLFGIEFHSFSGAFLGH